MKGGKRTAKGRIINIDDVIAASQHSTAVGNMGVNAQGDQLGKGGEITATREQRTRAYYKDHPQASNKQVSLKGDMSDKLNTGGRSDFGGLQPDTAHTAQENVRTAEPDLKADAMEELAKMAEQSAELDLPAEPEEFDVPESEPTGFREVELDNGDIEMQPYWDDAEDTEPDPDNSSKLA